MRLVLPLPANIGNARLHWRAKLRQKKHFYAQADERQLYGLVPSPPRRAFERASVQVHFLVHNRMDRDNLAARCKWILDWLVTRGYIADDGPDVVEWVRPTQEIERKNKRAVVTLEEL